MTNEATTEDNQPNETDFGDVQRTREAIIELLALVPLTLEDDHVLSDYLPPTAVNPFDDQRGPRCLAFVGELRDYARLVRELAYELGGYGAGRDFKDWDKHARLLPYLETLVIGVCVDASRARTIFYWPTLRVAE